MEPKKRAPRKKVTLETYLTNCDNLIVLLEKEIERKQREGEKGTRILQSAKKLVDDLKKEAPKLANAKKKKSTGGTKVSGFVLKCRVSDEMAEFMKLEPGAAPSRNEITNAICTYVRLKEGEKRPQILKWAHLNPGGQRNLQDPNDKMTIIPDERLSKLLRYEDYKKRVSAGEVKKTVTDKETHQQKVETVLDTALKYWVIQKLYKHHIVETLRIEKT